jgi:peptidoglycan/xylan/chitin deacetylase (PgdA/CDA1 family)
VTASWASALKRALHGIALRSGASVHWAHRRRGLRILKFHGVGGPEYPREALEAELAYIGGHVGIVPLAWVVERVRRGDAARHQGVALTFDDGLSNNRTVAYPILERLGLPATFFLCPDLIERGRWLWNHEASARLRFLGPDERRELARQWRVPATEPEAMVNWMKTLVQGAREHFEEAIRRVTARFAPTSEQRQRYDVMTWDDVAAIDPGLVSVGSHTLMHPVLPCLGPAALAHEIRESRRRLESRLARPVEDFCYPFGAWTPVVADEARHAHRAAVTSDPGWIDGDDDLHALQRISATPRLALLAWRLHRPTA